MTCTSDVLPKVHGAQTPLPFVLAVSALWATQGERGSKEGGEYVQEIPGNIADAGQMQVIAHLIPVSACGDEVIE